MILFEAAVLDSFGASKQIVRLVVGIAAAAAAAAAAATTMT